METPTRIIVVGGGPAGTFAAIGAKQQQPAADVVLLSDEPCEPYEKPPLSKAVLLGTAHPADAPIAGPGGVAGHGVRLEPNARVRAIERGPRTLHLDSGQRLAYDSLVIATGSVVRELPHLPEGAPGVHYLRTQADATTLLAQLRGSRQVLIVGAGLIGLEVAASAAQIGLSIVVVEVAPRILSRVCDEPLGAIVEAEHRRRGVDLQLATSIEAVETAANRTTVVTSRGVRLTPDAIVVGTGARPNDALAREAGLDVDDGIVVDSYCRTSDGAIFAAGDVVRFPGPHGPVRLENWRHAQDQGTVAGRNAAGAGLVYTHVPSFWSEQYDLYIQGVGWPLPATERVVRPMQGRSALSFDIKDGRIVSAQGINVQRDLAAVRRLIERGITVDATALADPGQPLAALLKR